MSVKIEKKNREPKEMTTKRALFGFLAPILVLVFLIGVGAEVTIAALVALFLMIAFCVYMGYIWKTIDEAMAEGVRQIATASMIMLLVGCLIAVWMSSGTIPTLLYYGMKIITPKLFLPICFILPAFMAVCAGTSWGSISTIGVILCGMSAGLGIPLGMTAGAVISGAFFGDKMSPLSDTTLLAASSVEVPLFDHIKSMWYTTIPATIISLILYTILGIRASGNINVEAVNELSNGLSATFNINIIHIIPVVLVLILSIKQVPAFISFGIGIGSAIIWSMVFQGHGFIENLGFIMSGFSVNSGVAAVDTLVNRGGFSSMLSLVGILLVLGMLSGLFSQTGVLNILVNKLSSRLNTPGTLLLGVWFSALLICLIGGQYPAIAITAVAYKDVCDRMDIHRVVLSRTLEDVGTMVAAIIPWSAWVIGYGVVLGGVTVQEFIPYTFLCMLCPIISLVNNFLGIGLFHKDDEVKYRPFWRRKKA
ncbi:Na+/H+ antiporter NhaC family protein [uncultured Sphaerochaeta sp.]|uniref:Na+/H+ antiporter NhaC family protein n=1 Tax=uncultured Sphaerochaeta sp. TaxID=886478 RepID=UPI002A0A7569|nr:Na+/H+ antiporter NhaC family protein [uncultured Sphaerochaeta sp.]